MANINTKKISLLIIPCFSFTLIACSFDGFKPPKPYDFWRTKKISSYHEIQKFYDTKRQDMLDCGIDPVIGDSNSAKSSICMESKGWYLERGPACEDQGLGFYDDPLCVQWRAKHHKK